MITIVYNQDKYQHTIYAGVNKLNEVILLLIKLKYTNIKIGALK